MRPGPCVATAKTRALGQTVNAREFSYSTCCTLQPLVARQFRGRHFGIESTAYVLLTKPPILVSGTFHFYRICRKKREPTSGLEPLSCSSYECAARHLAATELWPSLPNASTEATLNGLLVVAPTHRC